MVCFDAVRAKAKGNVETGFAHAAVAFVIVGRECYAVSRFAIILAIRCFVGIATAHWKDRAENRSRADAVRQHERDVDSIRLRASRNIPRRRDSSRWGRP